jgi:adenylate kinase family enzyme
VTNRSAPAGCVDRPLQVFVIGMSGSGKTTLAKTFAESAGVPWIGLDQIAGPDGWNWRQRPLRPLDERVRELNELLDRQVGWIVEGGYIWWTQRAMDEADAIVWLDLPWRTTLARLARRIARDYPRRIWREAGRRKLLAVLTPGFSELLFTIVQTWRIRHRMKDIEPSGRRPQAPKGDMDEISKDSLEALWHYYRKKCIRVDRPTPAQEMLSLVREVGQQPSLCQRGAFAWSASREGSES